jgi:tripartite-type tricarboxylate transporter receptor subunit TctC
MKYKTTHSLFGLAARAAFAAAAALALLSAVAPARAEYPERPVRIVNPYGPGGSGDTIQRLFAQKLSERTGRTFFVELKTGAAGRIAYETVAKSPADGYTLVASDPGYSILPAMFSKLTWDHGGDLVPVTILARTPHAVAAHPQSRFKSLDDVVQYARSNPGKVTFGHSGAGTTGFVLMQQFMREAKINLTHVPYKSGGEALGAVMSNSVDLMVTGLPTLIGQIKGGSMRVLAVTSEQRWPGAESVPTMVEQGANVVLYLWFGLMAPKGTPPSVVSYLHGNVQALLQDPQVKEALLAQAAVGVGTPPDEMGRLMQEDVKAWGQVLRAANITAE